MTNINFPQKEDIWFLVELSAQCIERINVIKQENTDVPERLELLTIMLNDAIQKISKLQDSNAEGIYSAKYYYQNLVSKI